MSEANTAGVHVWLVMWKATSALEAHAVRNIESLGICHSDFAVLEALLHKGPLPVNTIGKKVLLTSGSITTAVDRLEKRGLVERKWDEEDRRVCLVHLTKTGHELIAKAFADHAVAMEQAVAGLNEKERATLVNLAKKLGLNARAQLGGGEEFLPEATKATKRTKQRKIKQEIPKVEEPPASESGFEGFTELD